MEKKYKALALDLDGTLMDSNKELSDVNKKAVWGMKACFPVTIM